MPKTLGKTMKKQHPNACGTFNSTKHQKSKTKTSQKPLRVSMCVHPKTLWCGWGPLQVCSCEAGLLRQGRGIAFAKAREMCDSRHAAAVAEEDPHGGLAIHRTFRGAVAGVAGDDAEVCS